MLTILKSRSMKIKHALLLLLSCVVTILILSFLYLPISISLILYLFIAFFKERLLISYSINFSLLIALLFLYITSGYIVDKQFVSPHQKLIADPTFNFLNYPANKVFHNTIVSKGDLVFVDNLSADYSEDRKINFVTDKLGFRNKKDFVPGNILIVGDSYVVGNGGIDQNDTISSKLEKYTGKSYYNLGFPGDPFNYYHWLLKYDELVNSSEGIILFIFEGNDLNCPVIDKKELLKQSKLMTTIKEYLNKRLTIFENTVSYKLGFGLYNRAYNAIFQDEFKTYRSSINGKKIAFLKDYVDILYVDEVCATRLQQLSAIYDKYSKKIKLVVYVPTKGHIYYESLGNKKPSNLKSESLHELAKKYNIDYIDLSDYFQKNKDKELLYFRDDSHWNTLGIDLAAKYISSHDNFNKE